MSEDNSPHLSYDEIQALKDIEKILGKSIPKVDKIKWDELQWGGGIITKYNTGFLEEDSHIVGLCLHNNQLMRLPESIGNLKNLKQLELGRNLLIGLPESIGNLINLEILTILKNKITNLPDSIGNLKKLKDFNAGDNFLSSLPNTFCNLKELSFLKLYSNRIRKLPVCFGNLSNLKELNLDNNLLVNLPESIGDLKSVQEIRLWSNYIENLPESIGDLTSLRRLILGQNVIEELPDSMNKLKSLEILVLRNNKISKLPNSLNQLSSLRILDLRKNKFLNRPKLLDNFSDPKKFLLDDHLSKNTGINPKKLNMKKIGRFNVDSGEITVTDPAHGANPLATFQTPKGEWVAFVTFLNENAIDSLTDSSFTSNPSFTSVTDSNIESIFAMDTLYENSLFIPEKWDIGSVNCEFEQCGIYDKSMLPKSKQEYDTFIQDNYCLTIENNFGICQEKSAVVRPIFSGGTFPVFYYKNERGFVIAIWVIFKFNKIFDDFIKIKPSSETTRY